MSDDGHDSASLMRVRYVCGYVTLLRRRGFIAEKLQKQLNISPIRLYAVMFT